jgi:hypothetical protein
MLNVKLVTGDSRTPAVAVDYSLNHDGSLSLVDADGSIVASVGPNQWVYVELPAS